MWWEKKKARKESKKKWEYRGRGSKLYFLEEVYYFYLFIFFIENDMCIFLLYT